MISTRKRWLIGVVVAAFAAITVGAATPAWTGDLTYEARWNSTGADCPTCDPV